MFTSSFTFASFGYDLLISMAVTMAMALAVYFYFEDLIERLRDIVRPYDDIEFAPIEGKPCIVPSRETTDSAGYDLMVTGAHLLRARRLGEDRAALEIPVGFVAKFDKRLVMVMEMCSSTFFRGHGYSLFHSIVDSDFTGEMSIAIYGEASRLDELCARIASSPAPVKVGQLLFYCAHHGHDAPRTTIPRGAKGRVEIPDVGKNSALYKELMAAGGNEVLDRIPPPSSEASGGDESDDEDVEYRREFQVGPVPI